MVSLCANASVGWSRQSLLRAQLFVKMLIAAAARPQQLLVGQLLQQLDCTFSTMIPMYAKPYVSRTML